MKKRKTIRIILLILMVLTVLFIWSNSLWSKDASAAQSGTVRAALQNMLDTLGIPLQLTDHFVRKAAHFLQFFLFGTEVTLYHIFGDHFCRRDAGTIAVTVFGTAFLDETLQIFSDRGPMIADVWLDGAGGLTAMLLVFAFYFLFSARGRRRKTQK